MGCRGARIYGVPWSSTTAVCGAVTSTPLTLSLTLAADCCTQAKAATASLEAWLPLCMGSGLLEDWNGGVPVPRWEVWAVGPPAFGQVTGAQVDATSAMALCRSQHNDQEENA